MQLSNIPGKLVLPFANAGGKSTIPVASQIGITAGAASLTDGFPPLTRTPIAAGGVPPSGLDMNGILYEMSAIIRWANAGGGYPYDGTFATDTNVGGYPKGARIMRSDGQGYWFNTVENNVTDPEAAGAATAGWVPDYQSGATSVAMSGSSVTLTPNQYGKPLVVITGTLSANLNLIFPALAQGWTVINNATGGYSITAKTASGSGVTLGTISQIVGDGTNMYAANPDSVQIVNNVATLRNIAPSLSRRIQTRGYYTDGDGGSAQYFPKIGAAPGTYVHNGGTVIVPNGGDGSAAWLLDITNGISVKQCGAKGLKGGGGDDSAAFATAVASFRAVYAPEDTYTINLTINNRTIIYGDGSTATLIKPYNTAVAVMTYAFAAMTSPGGTSYWNYHSEIRNIGFRSASKVGVGFTFAKTNPADYVTNDEYANNVKFYGCEFQGFNKGVQFPFGNIGSEFYSCGFSLNKYGVYTLNNKFGGLMHAGNKYFYAGEFHSNDCAVYLHNTADGFGALCFKDTIIEGNNIAIYAYIFPRVTVPVNIDNVWFEANGQLIGGSTTIDSWTGSTVGSQTLTNKTIIIDGDGGKVNLTGGFVGDVWLRGPNIEFIATNSRAEGATGFGGGDLIVDVPDTSYIMLENPTSDGGWAAPYVPLVRGRMRDRGMILNPTNRSARRIFRTNPRGAKVTNYGPSRAMSASLVAGATTGNGTFNLTGTVVSDGRIYNQCNEFSQAAFTSAQFTRLNSPNSVITTVAGWYVFTLDMKHVSGAGVNAYVWDRSTVQLAIAITNTVVGRWETFAAIGYSGGGETLYLDFSGKGGDVTWRISAYQIHRFDTLQDAQDFIASNVFAES